MKKLTLFAIIFTFLLALSALAISQTLNAPANQFQTSATSVLFNWTATSTTDTTTYSSLMIAGAGRNYSTNATVFCLNGTACAHTVTPFAVGFYSWKVTSADAQTNASVTSIVSAPYDTRLSNSLNILYTINGSAQNCTIQFFKNNTLNISTALANFTQACNLSARNVSGVISLYTKGIGNDEYINITAVGNATAIMGFTANAKAKGTQTNSTTSVRYFEIRGTQEQDYFKWENASGTQVMNLTKDTGDLRIRGKYYGDGSNLQGVSTGTNLSAIINNQANDSINMTNHGLTNVGNITLLSTGSYTNYWDSVLGYLYIGYKVQSRYFVDAEDSTYYLDPSGGIVTTGVSGVFNGAINFIGNAGRNLTGVSNIVGANTLVTIGNATQTTHSLTADDDLLVTGKLEVDGLSYLDANSNLADDIQTQWGSSQDAVCEYDTTEAANALKFGTSVDSNSIHIVEKADINYNRGREIQNNPAVYIWSNSQDQYSFLKLQHDTTEATIDTGTNASVGSIELFGSNNTIIHNQLNPTSDIISGEINNQIVYYDESNGTNVIYHSSLGLPWTFTGANVVVSNITGSVFSSGSNEGMTNTTGLWMCIDAACIAKCQVLINGGLITGCS